MATKEELLIKAKEDYKRYYDNSGDYQSRLCYELVELEDRIFRLKSFLDNGCQGIFEKYRKDRLEIQLVAMKTYYLALEQRFNDNF